MHFGGKISKIILNYHLGQFIKAREIDRPPGACDRMVLQARHEFLICHRLGKSHNLGHD